MSFDEDFQNSPGFYFFIVLILVIFSVYGVFCCFTGAAERGVFLLTVSALFYVALYYRLFCEDDQDV